MRIREQFLMVITTLLEGSIRPRLAKIPQVVRAIRHRYMAIRKSSLAQTRICLKS